MLAKLFTPLLIALGLLTAVNVGMLIDGFADSGSIWNPIDMVVSGVRLPFTMPWFTYPFLAALVWLTCHFAPRFLR